MATIGTIAINLVARTDRLRKDLRKGSQSISVFAQSTQQLQGGLGRIVAPLAATAAALLSVRAAYGKVKQEFADVDALAKTADKLGLTTEELASLRHAASITAGVTSQTLDMALQRMTRRLSEAASGTGEAKAAIKELGLSAKELERAGPAAAFSAIADAIQDVENPADRLRLSFKLFDSEGAALVNTLRVGSAGLAGFREDAEKLGVTLNRQDASKIESANDAMTRLGALFSGVARRIAVELAPFLEFAVESMVAFGTEGEGASGMVRGGVDLVIKGIGFLLDGVDLLRTGWMAMGVGGQLVFEGMLQGVAAMVRGIEFAAETVVSVFRSAFASAHQFVSEAIGRMIDLLARVATFIESKLPERFRIGIGNAANEFSSAFQDVVATNREMLANTDFSTDFKLGGETTTAFANAFSDGVRQAEDDFNKFANREKLSDRLKSGVEEVRAKADAAAENATAAAGELGTETQALATAKQVTPRALERGSQQAFSAFQKSQKGGQTEEQILAENKRQRKALETIARNPIVLGAAGI